jgi:hypothetical protein
MSCKTIESRKVDNTAESFIENIRQMILNNGIDLDVVYVEQVGTGATPARLYLIERTLTDGSKVHDLTIGFEN